MPFVELVLPFAALGLFMSLAYAAEENRPLRALVYGILLVVDILLLVLWASWSVIGMLGADVPSGAGMGMVDPDAMIAGLGSIAPLELALVAAAILLLFPPFRRPLTRLMHIDPDSIVHLVALHYALATVGIMAAVAVVIPIIGSDQEGLDILRDATAEAGLAGVWLQNFGFVVLAVLGVGLFVKRTPAEVAARLGLEPWVSVRWWLAVPALGLPSGWLVQKWWEAMDPSTLEQVNRISDALFSSFIDAGLAGALTVGLAAGIGEELLFRGALQPRFGIAATSLLFAAMHAQYTVSPALVQVFALSVVLGIVRNRANTTTAILGHATYNFILVMLAIYAPEISS